MKKYLFIIELCFIAGVATMAQTASPVLINMKQLSDFEINHPELFKPCTACTKKEIDGGWKGLKDMPVPQSANIKKQYPDNSGTVIPGNPLSANRPQTQSPAPHQTFLGQIDAGQTIPPDTHGAVGVNHVVTATNEFVRVHTKTGTVLTTASIASFAGVSNTCDPYILYDPSSKRWFYSAIDCSGQNNNRLAVVVSASEDPTGNWFRYSFVPNLPGGPFFLDHPYLGFDDRWLVISGRKFPNSGSFAGTVLFVLDKATLLANGSLIFGTNAQAIEKTTADGDSPLPVTLFGINPNPNTFYVLQNWNAATSTIRLSTITGNVPNATWNSATAVFPSGGASYASSPGDIAEQSGETRKLSTNDARISSGIMVNGNIWCAQHIGISPTNVAVQWWQLNGTAGVSFGNILQRGRIGDGIANNYRWFPSIAVNKSEDVIIGYTVSSNTSRVSSAYSFRTNLTPPNTTLEEYIYKVGLSTYHKTFGGTRARWGDYSHSAIDPLDESLWTIQEYADQRLGAADNDSRFGVWWAQVLPVSSLLQKDAGIGSIVEPVGGLICNTSITPKITIRNMGTDTLKTVEAGMLLDGLPLGAIARFNNLSLASFVSSPVITLSPDFTPAAGAHTLQVYTINPNGSPDLKTNNDTATIIFTIAPTLVLPYNESFESTPFPPANGSDIINENAGSVTWERSTLAGNPGKACITLNAYNYTEHGQRDIYQMPKLNVAILDSVEINFNVAYKEFAGSADSLLLLYSPDCGTTWLPTGFAKGGTGLSTSAGTIASGFVPTATEWRTEKVVLKDFCSKNLKSIMIGFQSYNDFGNNIYVDGINITGFESARRNMVLNAIIEPPLALCTNSLTPAVSFSNDGLDTIRSLKINYQVDGGPVISFNWTGSLAKCNTASIQLNTAVAVAGTHVLTVFISEPNGLADQVTSNDTLRKTVTIYNTTPLPTPVIEGFESANIPGDNWGIQNLDGLKTWARSTTTSKTGIGSLWINNPASGNANNATDNFITPIVANIPLVDSMFVSWDYAYKAGAGYPGSTVLPVDTLELLITQDCGISFTSVWKKWGKDLQTVIDTNYSNTTSFVPTLSVEWKTGRVYLTPLIGSASFQVYFSSKSNKQNNLWLDNINISAKTLPQRLKNQGYLIYPIPFRNSFLIHHVLPPVNLKAVQVYNSAGQLVRDNRYNGNANTEVNIDLGNLASGVYVLKMIYSNKIVVERIVKN
ncbi:MAG: T9SS type A sorting domain-containing protein [Ferruginibacter sp.]|nr:T9SS type A sorting domain-containing protein [Ferruginibacter sp.]